MPRPKKPKYNNLMKSTEWWPWWHRRRDHYKNVYPDGAIASPEAARLASGDLVRRQLMWWKNRDEGLRLAGQEAFLPVAWYDLATKNIGLLPIPVWADMPSGRKPKDYEGGSEWIAIHEQAARADMEKYGKLLDSDFQEYMAGEESAVKEDWRKTVKPLPERRGQKLRGVSEFKAKTASPKEIVVWVADHLIIKGVEPKECPCAAAWALLHNALAGPQQESKFWEIWGRFLPTRAQVEKEAELREGGREPEEPLAEFMAAAEWEKAQAVVVGGNGRAA